MSHRLAALLSLIATPCLAQGVDPTEALAPLELPPPSAGPEYLPFEALPPVELDEARNGFPLAQRLSRERGWQGRVLWIDATANLEAIGDEASIQALVARIQKTGFNTIVLDVKPISGETLYPSAIAPKLVEWQVPGRPLKRLPAEFDPLAAFVAAAHGVGLGLVASLNVFSEGHTINRAGPGWDHPEWQTTLYEPKLEVVAPDGASYPVTSESYPIRGGARPMQRPADLAGQVAVYTTFDRVQLPAGAVVVVLDSDHRVLAVTPADSLGAAPLPPAGSALAGTGPAAAFLRRLGFGATVQIRQTPDYVRSGARPLQQFPLMTNPHDPVVTARIRAIVEELVRNYPLDGVIFDDRLRYAGINADFSAPTRAAFEHWLGAPVAWPDEVFRWAVDWPSLRRQVVPGPRFEAWLVWRALTLRNWVAETIAAVKASRPSTGVAAYVGSWYGEYPVHGSNWAAADFRAGFRFLTDAYRPTGYAQLLDWLTTGCYYRTATIQEARVTGRPAAATVEAAAQLSTRAANGRTWVYAGLSLDRFGGDRAAFERALQAAAAASQGVMIFDLSHFALTGDPDAWWDSLARAFAVASPPPDRVPGATAELRRRHAEAVAAGAGEPAVVLETGIAGTGF